MNKSDSIKNLSAALTQAQAEMPAVKMNSTNPFLKSKFADLGAVIESTRPHLAKFGLSISQFPSNDGANIALRTIIMHSSGEWLEDVISLPLGEEKGKSNAQVAGSVITYLRRYSWSAVCGVYADEDTDGSKPEPKPAQQAPKPAATREDTVKRYELLADKAVKLGLSNVMTLTAEMSIDDINAIGKTLKLRVEEKEKAGK